MFARLYDALTNLFRASKDQPIDEKTDPDEPEDPMTGAGNPHTAKPKPRPMPKPLPVPTNPRPSIKEILQKRQCPPSYECMQEDSPIYALRPMALCGRKANCTVVSNGIACAMPGASRGKCFTTVFGSNEETDDGIEPQDEQGEHDDPELGTPHGDPLPEDMDLPYLPPKPGTPL